MSYSTRRSESRSGSRNTRPTEFNENLRKSSSSLVRSEEEVRWCSELIRWEGCNLRRKQIMQNDMMGWDVDGWFFWKGELNSSGTGKQHCLGYICDVSSWEMNLENGGGPRGGASSDSTTFGNAKTGGVCAPRLPTPRPGGTQSNVVSTPCKLKAPVYQIKLRFQTQAGTVVLCSSACNPPIRY